MKRKQKILNKIEHKKVENEIIKEKELIRIKNALFTNYVNSKYFTTRCNMIAEQLNSGIITESVDGCQKSKDFFEAEYHITRARAIVQQREYLHCVSLLTEKYSYTEDQIKEILIGFLNSPINEIAKIKDEHVAEFVQE
jgi:alpha-acetolactate decarboxylase